MASRLINRLPPEIVAVMQRHLNTVPVKLGILAKELGLTVKSSHMKLGVSGQVSNERGQYLIRVNRYEPKKRQRFTVAHEIAHFLLHCDRIDASTDGIKDNVLYRSGFPEKIEVEANRMAAEILMPEAIMKEELKGLEDAISDEIIELLATKFDVSKAAMEIRISSML